MALAFLASGPKQKWPDLLVALRNGAILRLRYFNRKIHHIWQKLWNRLGLEKINKKLEEATRQPRHEKPTERKALMLGIVEQLPAEVLRVPEEELSAWVETTFRSDEVDAVLMAGVQPILEKVQECYPHRKSRTDFWPALLGLVKQIYDRAHVEILDRIDLAIRSLRPPPEPEEFEQNPEFEELFKDARQNRATVWEDKDLPRSAAGQAYLAAFGLEIWANPYWSSDTVYLSEKRERALVGMAGFSLKETPESKRQWLVIATHQELEAYPVHKGRLRVRAKIKYRLDEDFIEHMIALPCKNDALVFIARASGRLELFRLDTHNLNFLSIAEQESSTHEWDEKVTMAACAVSPSAFWVAVIFYRKGRSHLKLVETDASGIRVLNGGPMDLVRINTVALSYNPKEGARLFAGASNAGPLRLYRISRDEIRPLTWYQELKHGTVDVCFDDPEHPRYILAGERNGFLWCIRLEAGATSCLAWTHRMARTIRDVEPLNLEGKKHFLIGAEDGHIILLEAATGRRVWEHDVNAPIRRLLCFGQDGETLAVAIKDGRLSLFTRPPVGCTGLGDVEQWLEKLASQPEEKRKKCWLNPDYESVHAVYRLEKDPEEPSYETVLKDLKKPCSRRRMIRHMLEVGRPAFDDRVKGEVLRNLPPEDIFVLLSYLETLSDWEPFIETRLRELVANQISPEVTRTTITWLQQQEIHRPTPKRLKELFPGLIRFEDSWSRIEFSRLLLKAVLAGSRSDEKEVFIKVFPWLFRLDPRLSRAVAEGLPYKSPVKGNFEVFADLMDLLLNGELFPQHEVKWFADLIRPYGRDDAFYGLISGLLDFLYQMRTGDIPWDDRRDGSMEALRRLIHWKDCLKRSEPPLDSLVNSLGGALSPHPLPGDLEPFTARHQWLEGLRLKLHAPAPPVTRQSGHPWEPVIQKFVILVEETLDHLVTWETELILRHVRPRLELISTAVDDALGLCLKLRTIPEGFTQLHDVTLVFDVAGEDGLLPPGNRRETRHLQAYPENFSDFDFTLDGFLRGRQENVDVYVTLEDGSGYRTGETWRFKVPRPPASRTHQLWLHESLPTAFEAFLEMVLNSKAAVTLVEIDRNLGRDQLIMEWLRQSGGRQVNLDAELRDYGSGRFYAARRLDLELILEKIKQARGFQLEKRENQGQGPLLIGPVDEVLERAVKGEAPQLLGSWLEVLRRHASTGGKPRHVIIVSSTNACRLRALGLGNIAELSGYLFIKAALRDKTAPAQSIRKDLVGRVKRETGWDEHKIIHRLDRLGWDIRLIQGLLRWLKQDHNHLQAPLKKYQAQAATRDIIIADLASLEPFDLIFALFAARAVTHLDLGDAVTGQVVGENYRSATRQSVPKLFQKSGAALTERSLNAFRTDLVLRHKHLVVRGFGVVGTLGQDFGYLGALLTPMTPNTKKKRFRRLADLTIGSEHGGIFHTDSPYRELILELYRLHKDKEEARRDTAVYREIKGQECFPLEGMDLEDIARFSTEDLENLMPSAEKDDLRRLLALAELWLAPGGDTAPNDALRLIRRLFKPEEVTLLRPKQGRWDNALRKIPFPVFGLGRDMGDSEEPVEYLVWAGKGLSLNMNKLRKVVDEITNARKEQANRDPNNRNRQLVSWSPKVMLLGPGLIPRLYDETRKIAVLKPADLLQSTWEGNLIKGLRDKARAQMRLTTLSPFQASSALPPGSPLFVGRETELDFIKSKIRGVSILIVGSRRVGKTSLLNQIQNWAEREEDLEPIYLDLQGADTSKVFAQTLRVSLKNDKRDYLKKLAGEDLETLARQVKDRGKLCLFLLNEVDGMVHHDPRFVETWRGLNDRKFARFLMVGYSAIAKLGNPRSPFFHFTEGTSLGGKAIPLTALLEPAARALLDVLETSELRLRWQDPEQKAKAYQLCLARSYRIPWVVQRYCQLFVERLEEQRRTVLTYADVAWVLEREGQVVWQYIDSIHYQSLGYAGREQAQRPGFKLILFTLARHRYFLGGNRAAVLDERLPERSSLSPELGFSVGEARKIVLETVDRFLLGRERDAFRLWFEGLNLSEVLRLLTLTLVLEPDPMQEGRYGFLLHILPRELQRLHGRYDPTLDELILTLGAEFLDLYQEREKTP